MDKLDYNCNLQVCSVPQTTLLKGCVSKTLKCLQKWLVIVLVQNTNRIMHYGELSETSEDDFRGNNGLLQSRFVIVVRHKPKSLS